MKIDLDELRRHREVLSRIGGHGDVEDARVELNNSSPGDRRLVLELSQLDEVDWEQLRGTLEEADPDLWTVVQSAREAVKSSLEGSESHGPFQFASRIVSISFAPYFDLGTGAQINRLIFKTAGESFISDQDLEDTLGIGASVLDAAAKSVDLMVEEFGIRPERIVWGDDFEARLALAEEAARRLRRLYAQRIRVEGEPTSSPEDA